MKYLMSCVSNAPDWASYEPPRRRRTRRATGAAETLNRRIRCCTGGARIGRCLYIRLYAIIRRWTAALITDLAQAGYIEIAHADDLVGIGRGVDSS